MYVTTIPEGENNFKMPRASVVHMTSTATRPQHMSQVRLQIKSNAYFTHVAMMANDHLRMRRINKIWSISQRTLRASVPRRFARS
ncbi:hypothetical protein X777_09457 [Ooceraea biroi]|uniref:Uncharacterized protein n=1 Tax=Ooceraea biroi TaxID=2015173 RepID=A0A026W7T8_OOCBI|nr:hypothetical protein X777_09457 [Ooceraea biroi]